MAKSLKTIYEGSSLQKIDIFYVTPGCGTSKAPSVKYVLAQSSAVVVGHNDYVYLRLFLFKNFKQVKMYSLSA